MDLTVARDQAPTGPVPGPPRWPMLLLVLGALAILPLWGRERTGDPPPSTTAAAPPTTPAVGLPATNDGQRLIGSTALRRGPGLTWSELPAPPETTTIHAVGEFREQVWIVAGTSAPDLRGLHTGATVYVAEPNGWEARWELDADSVVIAADISGDGIAILSTETGAARTPYVATDLRAHTTADGSHWTSTPLDTASQRVTNLGIVAGSAGVGAWVHAITAGGPPRAVIDALPVDIAAVVATGIASVHVEADRLIATGPLGFELFAAPLADLDITSRDLRMPPGQRSSMLWRAATFDTFTSVPSPSDSMVIDLAIGAGGELIATTAEREVWFSGDGSSWSSATELAGGTGQPVAQRISDVGVSIHHDRVQALRNDIADVVFQLRPGTGFSPNVDPAAGPAGLAILTAADGPDPRISHPPAELTFQGARFEMSRADATITVITDDGSRSRFHPSSEDVRYHQTSSELVLDETWRLPIEALERAHLASIHIDTSGPFGVAFSRNGQVWGWSPIVDENGYTYGPVSMLSVGADAVYAVRDLPQIRTAPRTQTPPTPLLLVGTFG